MKILYLSSYSHPERVASTYLGSNRNEAFAKAGFQMECYTPTPSRGVSDEVRKKYKKIKEEKHLDGAYTLYRFPLYKESKNSALRAIRYVICCANHLWYGLKAKDIDLVFLSSTPPIMGLVGTLLKKIRKIPFVYNLQDIFPDSLVGTGLAKKNGIIWKIGRVIENITYRNADKIIVISEDFKKNIMAKGVPESKIKLVYNWVDENAVVDIPRNENKLFKKYKLDPNKFYITYSGNIGLTQNMDLLLEVAEDLKSNHRIQFVLIGEGAYKDKVEKFIKDKNLKNITLLPFQPYEDISHVFSLGDVGLVISKPNVGSNSVPSKTWSILSASRPVLANFDPNELKQIINNSHCGVFTEAGDKATFIEAIQFLADHPDECVMYGKNGRKFIEANLTKEIGTSKLVNIIKEFENNR